MGTLELHGELIQLGGKVVQPVPPGSYMLPVTRGPDFVKSGHHGQDGFCGNKGLVLVPTNADLLEWCTVFLDSNGKDGWTPWTSLKVGWRVGSSGNTFRHRDHTYFYKSADYCPLLNLGRRAWDIGTTCNVAQASRQLNPSALDRHVLISSEFHLLKLWFSMGLHVTRASGCADQRQLDKPPDHAQTRCEQILPHSY